ncbi:glutathione synthetase [Buchnera aphidicola (Nipponaphis monzeni)]|uniref:Glutathione synthetase n=1 Tax=Buchnera aphidicola (Nipponaphis monzeni) TaxID=2495405 RepID=A0A455TAR2_9GAMM|nr:glutathione synthase [Buchnera aphidicola]BBI01419.1 glutathione synthetase [Buchnera aphidicola (Nipponaphis monzeni)]
MNIKLGVIMDPINTINKEKDSTIAVLIAAQERNYQIYYIKINDLYLYSGKSYATTKRITFFKNCQQWFSLNKQQEIPLSFLDVILIRKNPPFDLTFLYATQILEFAEKQENVLMINKPKSLRDCNEKIFASYFTKIIPNTLITNKTLQIKNFYKKYKDIIFKPLDGMGGSSIFRVKPNDPNFSVIIETMTKNNTSYCMVQSYIPDIKNGDKRILILHGHPIPYCLARIPQNNETRGNLAAGGKARPQQLDENDYKISNIISPILQKKGLLFVGIDVIGKKLTEINVTSPTGICEIEKFFSISITKIFLKGIEKLLKKNKIN